jgi:hypothetical protein
VPSIHKPPSFNKHYWLPLEVLLNANIKRHVDAFNRTFAAWWDWLRESGREPPIKTLARRAGACRKTVRKCLRDLRFRLARRKYRRLRKREALVAKKARRRPVHKWGGELDPRTRPRSMAIDNEGQSRKEWPGWGHRAYTWGRPNARSDPEYDMTAFWAHDTFRKKQQEL